jgi:hypothetical protein
MQRRWLPPKGRNSNGLYAGERVPRTNTFPQSGHCLFTVLRQDVISDSEHDVQNDLPENIEHRIVRANKLAGPPLAGAPERGFLHKVCVTAKPGSVKWWRQQSPLGTVTFCLEDPQRSTAGESAESGLLKRAETIRIRAKNLARAITSVTPRWTECHDVTEAVAQLCVMLSRPVDESEPAQRVKARPGR